MICAHPPPLALLAELTHRCPLRCFYCSNPLELTRADSELGTSDWRRVFDQAADMGVLQIHFSGGEPMVRRDLDDLVRHATSLQLYTNLITSGVLLTDPSLDALVAAGIDHIQLSFQDSASSTGEWIAGYRGAHQKKMAAATRIKAAKLPLTLNFVLHRHNAARTAEMIMLGECLGAERIEIAHTQYYGWALRNRAALLPSLEQINAATAAVEAARVRLNGRMVIDYIVPDYFATRPKACMSGWAQRFINISPEGKALPCHAAETIPGMTFASVREQSLAEIWANDAAFNRFRGTDWMPAPCRGCDRAEIDWGGCRCQALALTGDAAATDPVCGKSRDHRLVLAAIAETDGNHPLHRRQPSAASRKD